MAHRIQTKVRSLYNIQTLSYLQSLWFLTSASVSNRSIEGNKFDARSITLILRQLQKVATYVREIFAYYIQESSCSKWLHSESTQLFQYPDCSFPAATPRRCTQIPAFALSQMQPAPMHSLRHESRCNVSRLVNSRANGSTVLAAYGAAHLPFSPSNHQPLTYALRFFKRQGKS